jgi:hypothetical protein
MKNPASDQKPINVAYALNKYLYPTPKAESSKNVLPKIIIPNNHFLKPIVKPSVQSVMIVASPLSKKPSLSIKLESISNNQKDSQDDETSLEEVQEDDEVLENFSQNNSSSCRTLQGEVYLKTKTERFKQHWGVLSGNDIFCYRRKNDTKYNVMHCLVDIYIKEVPEEFC